jgi:hypothetical protein
VKILRNERAGACGPHRSSGRTRHGTSRRHSGCCWRMPSPCTSRPRISIGTCRGNTSATITYFSTNRPIRYSPSPMRSQSGCGRSAEAPSDRSETSNGSSAFSITTRNTFAPEGMLAELRDDNEQFAKYLRGTHELCDEHGDVATASLIENWLDDAERRSWFLFETTRPDGLKHDGSVLALLARSHGPSAH